MTSRYSRSSRHTDLDEAALRLGQSGPQQANPNIAQKNADKGLVVLFGEFAGCLLPDYTI